MSEVATSPPVETKTIDVGAVHLRVTVAGPSTGPLVVLLHGFPDLSSSWTGLLPSLTAAGLRVAAPDLRGYGGSDAPHGVGAYRIDRLAGDVIGLLTALGTGSDPVLLVGHDWGGVVAWTVAASSPERIDRLAILNSPHPTSFLAATRKPAQLRRSWYMGAFQVPGLPERLLEAADGALLRRLLRRWTAAEGEAIEAQVRRLAAVLSRTGVQGGIHYYRAQARGLARHGPAGFLAAMTGGRGAVVSCPTLVLWGERDPVLGPELAEPPARQVPDCRIVRFPNAAHWVHWDEPEAVTDELVRFATPLADARRS